MACSKKIIAKKVRIIGDKYQIVDDNDVILTTSVYKQVATAVMSGKYNYILAQGSTRSSKTYNILIYLFVLGLSKKYKITIARRTLADIKKTVFRDFLEIAAKFNISLGRGNSNRQEMTYTLPNGTMFDFIGTEDEQKLRGGQRDILYMNEANEISYESKVQLFIRTTWIKILDYNPSFSNDHWINEVKDSKKKEIVFDDKLGVNRSIKVPNAYHFITTYKENPFLPQEQVDEIESLEHANYSLWQIYGLGLYAKIEGLVFPKYEIVDEFPTNPELHGIGQDFGYNDPTAIIECAIAGNDLYVRELAYSGGMAIKDYINILKEYPKLKVISESNPSIMIDELSSKGIDITAVTKGAGSILAGIIKMQEYNIKVVKGSHNIEKELNNYVFKQKKGTSSFLNEPIDKFNHAIDAIRYWVSQTTLGKENILQRIKQTNYIMRQTDAFNTLLSISNNQIIGVSYTFNDEKLYILDIIYTNSGFNANYERIRQLVRKSNNTYIEADDMLIRELRELRESVNDPSMIRIYKHEDKKIDIIDSWKDVLPDRVIFPSSDSSECLDFITQYKRYADDDDSDVVYSVAKCLSMQSAFTNRL